MERDIVDWLRQLLNQRTAAFGEDGLKSCRYGEAADEIERLRAIEETAKPLIENIRERGMHDNWKRLAAALEK